MNTDCQINHFCQVSAGEDVPVLWNSSSTASLENAPSRHCTFECNNLFLIQHFFSTPLIKCFLKCLQKLHPTQNSARWSEVTAIPVNPVLLLLLGRRPSGRREAEVFGSLTCRPCRKEEKLGKQWDATWPYLLGLTKMSRSFPAFSAQQQNQTSPPTKLQSVKENVRGRDSLCFESSPSPLHSLLSRPSRGCLLPWED